MITVWKYNFGIEDNVQIDMPLGAEILHVGSQELLEGERGCIWARVDTDEPLEVKRFLLAGTGHPLGDHCDAEHIGTFQMRGGALVFHLFNLLSQSAQVQ